MQSLVTLSKVWLGFDRKHLKETRKKEKKNLKTEDEFVPEWWEEKKRQFLRIREIEEKSEMGSS